MFNYTEIDFEFLKLQIYLHMDRHFRLNMGEEENLRTFFLKMPCLCAEHHRLEAVMNVNRSVTLWLCPHCMFHLRGKLLRWPIKQNRKFLFKQAQSQMLTLFCRWGSAHGISLPTSSFPHKQLSSWGMGNFQYCRIVLQISFLDRGQTIQADIRNVLQT